MVVDSREDCIQKSNIHQSNRVNEERQRVINISNIRLTEYNIQHIAHNVLSKHYDNIMGEVKIKLPNRRGARFDLVIFDKNGDAMFSVEIKRKITESHTKKRHYEDILGVPNYLISGMEQAQDAYNCIQEQIVGGSVSKAQSVQ